MPFVDIATADDYASLWYSTNTPYSNVGSFTPDKQTIVMLHPFAMDEAWCFPQLEDPRLGENYNIVTINTRLTGRSVCKFTGKYDLWVAAADIAHMFYHLRLPRSHIFASEVFVLVALRLAILFPELCLSLTLCNVPPQQERKDVIHGLDDILQLWCYAEDLESFEHANRDLLEFTTGKRLGKTGGSSPSSFDAKRRTLVNTLEPYEKHLASPQVDRLVDIDLEDELVAWWQVRYPPFRRACFVDMIRTFCHDHREPLMPELLSKIETPTMILQAKDNELYPVSFAEDLQQSLTGVEDGAKLQIIHGRVGYLTIVRASIVNQFMSKFLASLRPHGPMDLRCPIKSLNARMQEALGALAALKENPAISKRSPASPISFSCCDEETAQIHVDMVKAYAKGQASAFSPLGSDGRPKRKFSERIVHWLQEEDLDGQDDIRRAKSSTEPPSVWVEPPPTDESEEVPDQPPPTGIIVRRTTEYTTTAAIIDRTKTQTQKLSVQKQLSRLLR